MRLTRRDFLAGTAASLPFAAYGQSVERPPARAGRISPAASIEQIFSASGLANIAGCALVDLSNTRLIEAHNPDLARPPASVTKAITALYAQAKLGNTHRFETKLLATGPITNGELRGDLYLIGSADPELDSNGLNELALAAKAAGIARISGKFYVVSTALPLIEQIDSGQPLQAGYNPSISGLNLNYNRVYFEWKRQNGEYSVSMDARSNRVRPRVTSLSMAVSRRASPVYGYEYKAGVERWSVARGSLGSGGGRWLPVRDSATYAAEVFQVLAAAQGVALPTAQKRDRAPRGTVIAQRFSNDLRTIQTNMLHYSTNLTAEVLGLAATKASGGRPNSLRSSAQAMGRWVAGQTRDSTTSFYNHSGLTDRSQISAREMAGFLALPSSQQGLGSILSEVDVQNNRGDAVEFEGVKILAKSGTLNFTRGLAGYIEKSGQPRYAFAIFSADMAARRAAPQNEERPAGARRWRGVAKVQEKALVYRWAKSLA